MLILPEATLEIARERAEQIGQRFRQMKFEIDGNPLGSITLSLGVVAFPQHGEAMAALLRAADAALYRAKSEGRDRASIAPG